MRITERQLRRIIRDGLIKESHREEEPAIVYLGDGVKYLAVIAYDAYDLDMALNLSEVDYNGVIAGVRVIPHGQWGPCNGAWHVEIAATSKKGWGSKVYLAALDRVGQLSPDRWSVSKEAENAWKRLADKYKLIANPFDDKDNPNTPPEYDDCTLHRDAILDASYELPNGLPPDIQDMIASGAEHFKDITERGERKRAAALLETGLEVLFNDVY